MAMMATGREGHVSGPILTIYNQHTADCGTPPAFRVLREPLRRAVDLHVRSRDARLRGGDVGWASMHTVREGRVDGLIPAPEEVAWLQACWRAAVA